jgi:hypothetical protein
VVHLVTLLEDMPVTETLEAIADLQGQSLPVGSIIVNAATVSHFGTPSLAPAAENRLDIARLGSGLAIAGIDPEPELLSALSQESADHAFRVLAERACRQQLEGAGVPMLSLPRLVDGADLGGVYELADHLAEQGVGR